MLICDMRHGIPCSARFARVYASKRLLSAMCREMAHKSRVTGDMDYDDFIFIFAHRKTCGNRTGERPACGPRAFLRRACTHTYVLKPHRESLDLSRKQPGFPFGSVMPYGLDEQGRPIFLISTMAMHTQNLRADPRASLLVTQEDASGDPLGASRVTLVGNALPIPQAEVAEVRALYLARHANSRYWVDFEDFSFYRMQVVDVYYVGGFGVMGWVTSAQYDDSRPDPLADSMAEIVRHMNADHKGALVLLAGKFAHIEAQEATMTAVDRLGFHVRLKTQDGVKGSRIAFLREVANAEETRKVLVEMVHQARSSTY